MKQFEIKISNSEVNYEEAVMYMESRVDGIINNKSKELLWFLNHNHIFTQGTSASKEEILNSNVIDVIKSNPVKVKSDARTKNINIYKYINDIIDAINLSSTLLLLYFKFIIALG